MLYPFESERSWSHSPQYSTINLQERTSNPWVLVCWHSSLPCVNLHVCYIKKQSKSCSIPGIWRLVHHGYVKLYVHLACSNNGPLALQITVQQNSTLHSILNYRKLYPFSLRKETVFQYYATGQQSNESLLLLRCVTLLIHCSASHTCTVLLYNCQGTEVCTSHVLQTSSWNWPTPIHW